MKWLCDKVFLFYFEDGGLWMEHAAVKNSNKGQGSGDDGCGCVTPNTVPTIQSPKDTIRRTQ
jgi:hypothetical protein